MMPQVNISSDKTRQDTIKSYSKYKTAVLDNICSCDANYNTKEPVQPAQSKIEIKSPTRLQLTRTSDSDSTVSLIGNSLIKCEEQRCLKRSSLEIYSLKISLKIVS